VRCVTPVEETERRLAPDLTAPSETSLSIRTDAGNTSKRIAVGFPETVAGVSLQTQHEQDQDEGRCGQSTGYSKAGIPR
jgi:hypothetical protein